MRKRLSMLLVLCLSAIMAYGVIGSGAQFLKTVTATEAINVGTFDCQIIAPVTAGATIAADNRSVSYTAPTINSSAAGSAPFMFTVANTGSIDQSLTIATSAIGAPFSVISAPFAPVALAHGTSVAINTGIRWAALTNANLGGTASETWTVSCGEQAGTPLGMFGLASTNAANIAGTAPGHVGTIGPSVSATDLGGGSVRLDFTTGSQTTYQNCFEYVTDGNTPDQRLMTGGVPRTNYNTALTDGLFPFVCVGDGLPTTASVTLSGISLIQVRMSFGAEADYRFDWTSFPVAQ